MGKKFVFDDNDKSYFWDRKQTPERIAEAHLQAKWDHFWDKVTCSMWGAAGMVILLVVIIVLGRLGQWLVEHFNGSLIGFILIGAGIGWGWRAR